MDAFLILPSLVGFRNQKPRLTMEDALRELELEEALYGPS